MTGTEWIPYAPPRPMLHDTFLAYSTLTAPQIGVTISPDPLGPVNKIVRLVRRHGDRDHTIKAALVHIPQGAHVAVEHTAGRPSLTLWTEGWQEIARDPGSPPGWYVTVDDRVVLRATYAECALPLPVPPPLPWRVRVRRTVNRRVRSVADRLADRLGYRRDDEAVDW